MKRILIIILAIGITIGMPSYALNACATVAECDQTLADIAKQKEEKDAEISAYKAEEADLSTRIEKLADDIKIAEEEITALDQSILVLADRIVILTERIAATEGYIKDRLVIQQKQNNSNTYLALLVSATSITDLMKRWSALDSFNREDKNLLTKLAADKAELAEAKTQQEERQATLETLKTTLIESKRESEAAIAEKRAIIVAAEDAMAQIQMTEEQMQAQRDILNRPIPEVPSIGGGGQSPLPNNGGWTLPVADAVVTTMYMSPTYQRQYGRTHPAIDVGKYEGAPMYAVADGWVILNEYHSQMGNVVAISHNIGGTSYVSFYAHQSSVYVSRGDYVTAGTQISTMGNTGSASDGAHLHFELYQGRDDFTYDKASRERYSVDPLYYLPYEGNWSIRWDAY